MTPGWLPAQGLIREHYEYALWCTDAPGIYHVASMLTAISAICADSTDLTIAGDHHPLNVWTMIVGRSSLDRKTTSTRLAIDRIRPTVPNRVHTIYGSPEGFLTAVAEQPCGVLYIPEGASFFEQREASYWRHGKSILMDLYDYTPELRRKLARSEVVIRKPRLSILSACAQPLLEYHTKLTDWLGGFLPRFLLIAGPKEHERPTTRADRQIEGHIESMLYQTYNASWGALACSSGAIAILQEFSTEIARGIDNFPPGIHPALARLPEAAIRMSALYEIGMADRSRLAHMQATQRITLVTPTAARHAVALCRASRDDALLPLAELTAGGGVGRDILRVETLIRSAGIAGIKRKHLMRRTHMLSRDLDKVIETLTQQEAIDLRVANQSGRPGRPAIVYTHTEAQADALRQARGEASPHEVTPWVCVEGTDAHQLAGLASLDEDDDILPSNDDGDDDSDPTSLN
jgi:hypothetical protein